MERLRKPEWLKIRLSQGEDYRKVRHAVSDLHLNTICQSGDCPNQAECWSRGTATFMILGDICTRNCSFCAVTTGKPLPPDPDEAERVAESVQRLALKHCVLTSVDRDDLPDLGASAWVAVIRAIRKKCPQTSLEVLIPDFQGRKDLVQMIIDASPEVISHNLETVRRLTPAIRSVAGYDRSLEVLRFIAANHARAKSGIMLGLGESPDEILETMDDLLEAGCRILTLGQYLQPARRNHPVVAYVHPDTFAAYKETGLAKGFYHVESAPLVRSSYHAERHV